MLTHLSIKNYALIAYSTIDFTSNLSIITGETGAGKSILLDALGLVLGKRADLNALRNADEKCVIEAHFAVSSYNMQPLFQELELDYEEETIIRREILPSGKSRAFVNDVPTTLQALQKLGEALIDIHTQHQTQDLFSEKYQLNLIDVFANNQILLKEYQNNLVQYKKVQKKLTDLLANQIQASKELDYNSFLLDELEHANLKDGEQEELEAQFEVLNNVERITGYLEQSHEILNNETYGVNKQLYEVKAQLQKLAQVSPVYQLLAERVESSFIEIEDISNEIESSLQDVIADPHQLELINQKLQLIYQLQKKHHVSTIAELITIQNDLSEKVSSIQNLDEAIASLNNEIGAFENSLNSLANQLYENRSSVIEALTTNITELIKPLGMPNAQFNIQLNHKDAFLATGKDEVQWLFSANKGMQFGLLKKTASGGELSRIMLAIKSILASKSNLPTIIFDEIDTGVSGDVADKMGNIMKEMGNYMQIFAITHLPQVAAKGTVHFKVAKYDDEDATVSEIKKLSNEARVHEIAQMLSGDTITEAALQHAKQLLN